LLACSKPSDATKDGSSTQGRGREVAVAVSLYHKDANFESAVHFAVLHQVSPDDTILNLPIQGLGRRCRTDSDASTAAPARRCNVLYEIFALLDILTEVQLDIAKGDLLGMTELLHNLKLERTLCKGIVLVYGDSNRRHEL
jgi:hypothetical protein